MKPLALAIAIALLFAFNAAARPAYPFGPVKAKLTFASQDLSTEMISSKTNISANATNVTQKFKSTVTNTVVSEATLLAMLANSFNTNFPAGAQLGSDSFDFVVLDQTGAVILDVSSVLSRHSDGGVSSGATTFIATQDNTGQHYSGNDTVATTYVNEITYDDTARTTGDGTHVTLELQGVTQLKVSTNFGTGQVKWSLQFEGQGTGMVQGKFAIITGTISGKASGTP